MNSRRNSSVLPCMVVSLLLMSGAFAQDRPVAEAAAPSTLAKASCASPVGTWVNQMGSKLKINTVDATSGAIAGEYQTSSGAGGWFPLVGWQNSAAAVAPKDNAKVVSFSVRWSGIGSVTSWSGFCRGTDELRTVWNLVRSNSDYEWDHILTGADNFRPE